MVDEEVVACIALRCEQVDVQMTHFIRVAFRSCAKAKEERMDAVLHPLCETGKHACTCLPIFTYDKITQHNTAQHNTTQHSTTLLDSGGELLY